MYGTCDLECCRNDIGTWSRFSPDRRGVPMSKRARKRRSRKGNKANHGRKPNA
jgi:hypothetical protein